MIFFLRRLNRRKMSSFSLKHVPFFVLIFINILFLIQICLAFQHGPNYINNYDKSHKLPKRQPVCSGLSNLEKFDCHPDANVTRIRCIKRGCCYQAFVEKNEKESTSYVGPPSCYFPTNYRGYKIYNVTKTEYGISVLLSRVVNSGFPFDIQNVKIDVISIDKNVVRIRITDNNQTRYEVPLLDDLMPKKGVLKKQYDVKLFPDGELAIIRLSTNVSVFNSDLSRLIYSDQFLQLSTKLPSSIVYGFGEHYDHLMKDMNWTRLTMFNKDNYPAPYKNLYGTQPFYLALENDTTTSHGVALFNSNAMDVVLQPTPAITYRTIGGILDFLVFLGPSPADVVIQYTGIVGFSFMPPYWSLGFHLCRFGMKSLNETRDVLLRNEHAGIPMDVQWNDMDYMDRNNDFTYDTGNFSGLPEFVDELHKQGMHYIIMVDPGVSGSEASGTYPPYDLGVKEDVFIKNSTGDIFVGKVWNLKSTVFPDFSNQASFSYWMKQFLTFHDNISFDGVWIDMNEISNFYNGTVNGCPTDSPLENPPYVPGGFAPLSEKTLCMSAKHVATSHYNEHNLHGYREGICTNFALRIATMKRPFVISRASFLGQGYYTGHWSGDVASTWEDMRYSIVNMLNFNMFGVSMVGSDICGFRENTTVELCRRWSALGSFYPFSRNHNDRHNMDQDPAAMGSRVIKSAKKNLYIRYTLLPYLYTLFYRSHAFGETVARPLFFEFPEDNNTHRIEEQFLWGPALMVMPVLYPKTEHVVAYLPKGIWYDFASGLKKVSTGQNFTFYINHDETPLSVRAGFILPLQYPNKTTTKSRLNNFMLFTGLGPSSEAAGELYWDDGDSAGSVEMGLYNFIKFKVFSNVLTSTIVQMGYNTTMCLDLVKVCGLNSSPHNVTVNGKTAKYDFDHHNCLHTHAAGVSLVEPIKIEWN